MLRLADRSRKARVVGRSSFVGELHFSPDSKSLGLVLSRRLFVYDIREREEATRGLGRHPRLLVLARLEVDRVRDRRPQRRRRRAVRPLLGRTRGRLAAPDHARPQVAQPAVGAVAGSSTTASARDGDAPTYNLFEIQPDGGSLRRITRLRIPPLMSGLVPLELSGERQAHAGGVRRPGHLASRFRVNPETGKAKALDDDFENGLVGFDLTADGRTVLGHTGGPDPTARHNVVTMPYSGGEPEVLVRKRLVPGLGSVTRPALG